MVKTNYYSSLNPVVVQALNNLQYRYSDKTPEMWCSHIHYPFKKLLEYNPKYFSKNGFIQMIERSYKDREFKAKRHSFYIYCTVCEKEEDIRNLKDITNKVWKERSQIKKENKYMTKENIYPLSPTKKQQCHNSNAIF
ncbi:hypothetical protein C1645_735908 [Glomus cerebriforme]|uniref:Uncharacterized protein n=1 Tax=Glomus cerebriforme TaxID=658196 RepID=A0A397T3R7_9GLOM|nr:hypothetical protein C1645_735908 [Glomus cerebriforme]